MAHTQLSVHEVEPANVRFTARQFPAPGPFGIVEVAVGGFSVQFFARGEDAARTLLAAFRTQAAVDVEMRS